MKKKNLFMALAALFVLAFASCNNEPEITGPGIDDGGNDSVPEVVGPEATPITVAEFIAAQESKDVYYELTGVIGGTIQETYGNFDLTDETGTVYVYGLTATYQANGKNDQSYSSLGLKAGDNITIRGYRGSYNGKVEVMGAFFVKKNSSGTGTDGGDVEPGDVLTVEKLMSMTVPDKEQGTDKYWIEAYIVGSYNFNADPKFQIGTEQAVNSSLLLADDPENADTYKVASVKLSVGIFRDALNLLDNPENYKKKVKLYGVVEKYCGINGVVNIEKAYLEGVEVVEPVLDGFYTESFAEGQGDFTIVDVLLPAGAQHIWYYNEQYKQMAASGYVNGASQNAESWLISPALDLSAKTSAIFTFEHAGKQFGAPVTNLTIQVSTTYNGGEINAADWTELAIPNHLAGETNTFKSAGDIDLSKYCGNSNVRVAFKYTSTTSGSGNWYVKNVVVRE